MSATHDRVIRSNPAGRLCKLLLGFCLLVATHAAEWHIETVPDIPGGKFTSLKLDRFGNAHVAHVDGYENVLRYSFWDRILNKWFTTDLGKSGGFCSLVLDSKQRPHISIPAGTGVTHIYWDGQKWQRQSVNVRASDISYFTSIALDPKDNPILSFYELADSRDTIAHLRVVVWNGAYWELRTVDPDFGSGKFNSMSSDSKGYPEIAYANVEYRDLNVSLRYARWNGQTWNTEILDRTGTSKWSVFMVLDAHDVPHIVYTDVSKHLVKYATERDGKWVFEIVDSLVNNAYPDRNGIALDGDGNPYVSYYDAGRGVLKVAHRASGQWVAELVDQGFAGYTSSIQIANDTVFVTYGDEQGQQLKFARRPVNPTVSSTTQGSTTIHKER